MTLPLYKALRAIGQGVIGGAAIGGVIYIATSRLGPPGLIGLAVLAGPGLLLLSYVLERRAKQAQEESE